MPRNMPIGNRVGDAIRPSDIQVDETAQSAPVWQDDAAATLVWNDYQKSRAYLENNTWLLEWQTADVLYQAPTPDHYPRGGNAGRPERVSRFIVAKICNVIGTQIKRALFGDKVPFFLEPVGETTQEMADAWTDLINALLKRMKFQYHVGLQIDSMRLQGTGIGKPIWRTRLRKVVRRQRKATAPKINLPMGETEVPTLESDEFEKVPSTVLESWPCYEYRRLGTTLFDGKWSTPNHPEESAGFAIDVDYPDFDDLNEMRQLSCYKDIPDAETLLWFFVNSPEGAAASASSLADFFTAMGGPMTHAEGENRQTSWSPLDKPLMLIERTSADHIMTLLVYEGRKLLIRNEEHSDEEITHTTCNFWNIDNSGYGIGLGRLVGPDQRINTGVLNECLKMIAYPFNAPVMIPRGMNAPTQNVLSRLGGFWAVDMPPGVSDVRRAAAFMEMPPVPPAAFEMLQQSQSSANDVSGANAPMMQGNLQSAGSTALRTAAGVNRTGDKADESIADPVDNVAEGVIVRTVMWLIKKVKEEMDLGEIRAILTKRKAKLIIDAINAEQFLNAEFEVSVLAGAKLAAKQGIQQVIPFFLQLVQQPQILQYYHQIGKTVDFAVMIDLLLEIAELQGYKIIRDLNPQEKQQFQQNNPEAAKSQTAIQVEQLRGQNKIAAVHAQAQDDLANKAAELAMQKTSDGLPLERAEALAERSTDEKQLAVGMAGGE